MKRFNIKNIIIIILCITIICMGIGFAYLSMTIDSSIKSSKVYDVSITKVTEGTSVKGGSTLPYATANTINNNKTVDFNFTLQNPKDTLTYNIVIKNEGDLTAKIDGIVESPNYTSDNNEANKILPVVITHNDIDDQILKPSEEVTLTVTATFTSSGVPMTKNIPYQVSILTSCAE